ncbi:AraC family transcriptional regulator [Pseudomonas sp. PA15(2017)]|uniref:AraC family transcriptional regulator n=1 Tax=Pseudomonas sp. PA15(2017) TaxID=1932111 RepID=UPI000960C8FB|nr:AraC family transcriptional regulator [Pseudomonas sp. PA15(2017)]OLU23648.1 AraC family transcriptional regulator [Pseudomonas sp. PA15(2017)]
MDSLHKLVEIIARHTPGDGIRPTAIAGVSLVRSCTPTVPMPVVYEPTLCLIVQGRKRVTAGATTYVYDAANYLIASVDVPVMGSVIEASEEQPYLCLVVDLDMTVLSDLALRYPADDLGGVPAAGIQLGETTPELLDAAARLAGLLDAPSDIGELAPLTVREILYRLLIGKGGAMVRQMVKADSRLNQIAKAIVWLRSHYAEACRIDDMADIAGMSRSTFHAHFKAVTAMSPLEFRTHLRLQEARRLMVAEALDAAGAGYRVGYESPSQFSRDYVRLFGLPPARDASRLRGSAWAPVQRSEALAAQA